MNDRTKAAVIGGVVAGVLSGLPIIGGCCFLWAIGGGFLAIWMYMKNASGPMEMGDAAKLGAVVGVVGAIVSAVLGIPFLLLGIGSAAMNDNMKSAGIGAGFAAAAGVGGLVLRAVFVIAFAVLGAIIGNAVLGKKGPGGMNTPPPPPSDFGGGGSYTPPPPAGGGSYGTGS